MAAKTARLLISCPDSKGIVAAVAGFIAEHDGNILDADQHTDPQHGEFFMRVEIDLAGFGMTPKQFREAWIPVADQHRMTWRVAWGTDVKRMAIFVTKESHCLNDLLWRWRTKELEVEIPLVISNHDELRSTVEAFEIPYHHLEVTAKTKADQEEAAIQLLSDAQIDLVVLARYMQILSPAFLVKYADRIINIHHSFLPAFAGPRPYHQAYDRGVKTIGATSHYVTEQLDQGPIIAQQTTPVNHRDTVEDLVRKGRDLERVVLATAVRLHVEDKILVSNNKTVVFE